MSDALKSNTTLIELSLGCENFRKNTQMASINNQLFPFSSNQQVTLETQERSY